MKLPLRFYGDPVLREKARPVDTVDDRLRALARNMIETMYAEEGIGLAAQQVGETVALFVVDAPRRVDVGEDGQPLNPDLAMPMAVFNPEIVESSEETDVYEEGCLSFPEIRAPVERPVAVRLRYRDEQGAPQERWLRGLAARVVQHEKDHLDGVLLVDRMSQVKRIALSGRLKRLRKRTRQGQPAVL